jgi:O-methyltransferase involved in polyketide biosynthesis
MDEVDAARGLLITAQGLFMYLDPPDVHRLIARCAARFPGAGLVFDAVPRRLTNLTHRASASPAATYRPPPSTWTLDRAEARRIGALAGVAELRPVPLPRGRGAADGVLVPLATRLPFAHTALLSIWAARFDPA